MKNLKLPLTIVTMLCLASAPYTFAQTRSVGTPASASAEPQPGGAMRESAVGAAPSANPEPGLAKSAPEDQKLEHSHGKKTEGSTVNAREGAKNPFWEPKDWMYIHTQGP